MDIVVNFVPIFTSKKTQGWLKVHLKPATTGLLFFFYYYGVDNVFNIYTQSVLRVRLKELFRVLCNHPVFPANFTRRVVGSYHSF